jgi:hypothetical protein
MLEAHPHRRQATVAAPGDRDHPGVTEFGEAASTLDDPVDPGPGREFQEGTLAKLRMI